MKHKRLSLSKLKTIPLSQRKIDADEADFGAPYQAGSHFADFLCSLPDLGSGADLFRLRDQIVTAKHQNRSIILGCGGHILDMGLSPLLIRLIEQGIISSLSFTGAALLQDVEISICGRTVENRSEDHAHAYVTDESGRLINEAVNFGVSEGLGIGISVGQKLLDSEVDHLDHSVVATAARYNVPVSVHPAIGADTFNLHPAIHGESLGAAGMLDFRLLAGIMAKASDGILINAASNMMLPRTFLNALDTAKNLGHEVTGLTTVLIDSAPSHSAIQDIIHRVSSPGGHGYLLPAPHEIMLPLLFAAVADALEEDEL
ncbi:MAG: hypothetical protein R8M38_02845 [Mariprofundaceae bacterium]